MERNWDYPDFTPESVGPEYPRRWNAIGDIKGYAPYLIQLPSGETVLCFNTENSISGSFLIGLGNDEAKDFAGFSTPFKNVHGAYWGSVFAKNSHTVMAVVMVSVGRGSEDDPKRKMILYSEGQLNHTIEAVKQNVKIDGSSEGWIDDSVFFVGSDSQAQATVRLAYDDEYLYILSERRDENIIHDHNNPESSDSLDIYLNFGEGKGDSIDTDVYRINLSLSGITNACRGNVGGTFEPYEINGADAKVKIYGTVNDPTDTDVGFVVEAKLPWNAFANVPKMQKLGFNAVLYNNDGDGTIKDELTSSSPRDWYTVILK